MASAWAVIESDGRVLFVQRSASTSRPLQWCFPGGGIQHGESAEAACVREVAEETGLQVRIGTCLLTAHNQSYFHCIAEPGEIRLKHNECVASIWVAPADLLGIGLIMELRRVIPALQALGYRLPVPAALRRHAALDNANQLPLSCKISA